MVTSSIGGGYNYCMNEQQNECRVQGVNNPKCPPPKPLWLWKWLGVLYRAKCLEPSQNPFCVLILAVTKGGVKKIKIDKFL